MSLSLVQSRALLGLEAAAVTVEVHLANGLPSFTLVGLAETEVKEARERVRSAIQNAGLEFPTNKKIVVNLAPADLPKDSGRFDLPIALGILAASGQIENARLAGHEFAGELSLSGELRPVRGALAMAVATYTQGTAVRLVLPLDSAQEAALVPGAQVYGAKHLLDVVRQFVASGGGPGDAGGDSCSRVRAAPVAGAPRYAGLAHPQGPRQGPHRRQARPRDPRSRRPQPADGGRAGLGQVDAGAPLRRPAAADERGRGTGKRSHRQPRRPAGARALDEPPDGHAAPHGERGGTGGRRLVAVSLIEKTTRYLRICGYLRILLAPSKQTLFVHTHMTGLDALNPGLSTCNARTRRRAPLDHSAKLHLQPPQFEEAELMVGLSGALCKYLARRVPRSAP